MPDHQKIRAVRFSAHAECRARERRISLEEVADIVLHPDICHPGARGHEAGRLIYKRGDVRVVTNEVPDDGVLDVISVMRRWSEVEAA
jgi:hypothetical protein